MTPTIPTRVALAWTVLTRTVFIQTVLPRVTLIRAAFARIVLMRVVFMRIRAVAVVVTPAGRTLAVSTVAALVLGYGFAWVEFVAIGWTLAALVACAGLWLLGTAGHHVRIEVPLQRVDVGELASVRIVISNPTRRRLPGIKVEVPVGDAVASFTAPGVSSGGTYEDVFVIPTVRRDVIPIGPARTVRADPLTIVRREFVWADVRELFVHPPVVAIPTIGSGFVRDLDGTATRDLTSSDMAFHAIREYRQGDDRRIIHWKSTAKTGTYMVRQCEESRRSHLLVVLSRTSHHYAHDDEFELAVSVAASIGVRALRDTRSLSIVTGAHEASAGAKDASAGTRAAPPRRGVANEFAGTHGARTGRGKSSTRALHVCDTRGRDRLLDGLSGIEWEGAVPTLSEVARAATYSTVGISFAFVVTGSAVSVAELRSAAIHFPAGVGVIGVICDTESSPTLRRLSDMSVIRIACLDDLYRSLERSVA